MLAPPAAPVTRPAATSRTDAAPGLLEGLLEPRGRTAKPRSHGVTIVLDTGVGLHAIQDLVRVAGAHCDYAKVAWGSALITNNLDEKLDSYRAADIQPLLGGTLFEYCYVHGRVDRLLAFCRERRIHVEISDGVAEIPRADKLRWIEAFAATGEVFSEIGGKMAPARGDWTQQVREELAAGAAKIIVEGREIGPVGKEIRAELVRDLVDAFGAESLVFEALERYQQVWLIKELGPNVNLGNIRIPDVLTVEALRQGLKDHTLFELVRQRRGDGRARGAP
jgi:phosphosulfolactate synthase